MSLPILVGLMIMIVLVARRYLDQCHVIQVVRHEAWGDNAGVARDRADMEKPQRASRMFAFLGNELSGLADEDEGKILKIYRWRGGNRLSKSRAIVLGGTWDQLQMTQLNGTSPHLGVLTTMAAGGVSNLSLAGEVVGILRLLRL